MKTAQNIIQRLFEKWSGQVASTLKPLPVSGSNRQYFRLKNDEITVIAAYNPKVSENESFLRFTQHFKSLGIPVPDVFAVDDTKTAYLLQDLGDLNLYQKLQENVDFSSEVQQWYERAIDHLIDLQIKGNQGFDYEQWCFESPCFDKKAMLRDLNYFKYYFLKVSGLAFDEYRLDRDFETLTEFLDQDENQGFMFRDFQSRNIMLQNNDLYFIDYQGGMKGPLQYDLISLIYQAKANISAENREDLKAYYLKKASTFPAFQKEAFLQRFEGFVLLRTLQVLGAYGFRGLYERKAHFLSSIPFAIDNLKTILENTPKELKINYLKTVLTALIDAQDWSAYARKTNPNRLTVTVSSFSYRRGIPLDTSGNGGGHVFDCRAIHNPGRYAPYKRLTGRDLPVIEFLETQSEIAPFLEAAFKIVDNSVEQYLNRNFTSLMVSFGCTGGQHRSVYATDRMAKHLQEKYDVDVVVQHIEQTIKNWEN